MCSRHGVWIGNGWLDVAAKRHESQADVEVVSDRMQLDREALFTRQMPQLISLSERRIRGQVNVEVSAKI